MNLSFEWVAGDHGHLAETKTFLDACASELNAELVQRECCGVEGWPQSVRLVVQLHEQFRSVPESFAPQSDLDLWSTNVAVAREQWVVADAVERRRLLLALALNVLIWLGYKIPADNSNVIGYRRTLGDLLILGGSHSSPAFKAWLKTRAIPKSAEDEESWDNPKKAHANARALMSEEWLWDITSDQSPFGNDDGWDMMDGLCEWLEENPRKNVVAYFQEIIDTYPQPTAWNETAAGEILRVKESGYDDFVRREELVIAFAFGLLVKRGYVPEEIRVHALGTCNRMLMPELKDSAWGESRVRTMISILDRVPIKPRQKPLSDAPGVTPSP